VFGLVMFYSFSTSKCYGYIGSLDWRKQPEQDGTAFGGGRDLCQRLQEYQYAIIASISSVIDAWFVLFDATSRNLLSAKKSI